MKKHLQTGALLLVALMIGLFVSLYLLFEPSNTEETVLLDNHYYDYLLEVHGDDSIPTYDLFDSKHNVVVYNIKASQLDSVIISDNE